VPWLPGQPDEEPLQGAQRGVERRLAEAILGPNARLVREACLEALRLLDVERFEVAEPGIGFDYLCGPPSEGQQLACLVPFEITGTIFRGDDSQAQTTSIRKRSCVVQAAVHDVLNDELP